MPVPPAASAVTSHLDLAHQKIDLATYYNAIQAPRGFALAPHHIPLCRALEDPRIENLMFLGPQGIGKSTLLCSVYPTWALGHDPTLAVLSVSAGERLPQTFMLASMQIIQHDPTFRRTFPDVLPDVGVGWSLDRGLFVSGHHAGDENPSYFSCGLASKALTGLHARLMVFDDIHDETNSRTPDGRAVVVETWYRTLMGRADARGCRRVMAGRWWAKDDLYQELIEGGEFVVLSLPAARPGNRRLWFDAFVPKGQTNFITETGVPETMPTELTGALAEAQKLYDRYRVYYGAADPLAQGFYWPASAAKRADYNAVARRQPRIARVNWNGDLSGAEDAVFTPEDFVPQILPFPLAELAYGQHSPAVRAFIRDQPGSLIESAWDTAMGQRLSEAMTAEAVGLMIPCNQYHRGEDVHLLGPCDFHYDVLILSIWAHHLDFGALVRTLRERYGIWVPRRVNVEEKASGISLLQVMRATQIPIRGQQVAEGKIDRAVNPVLPGGRRPPASAASLRPPAGVGGGAASVQGWCRMGRVSYPAGAPWALPDPNDPTEKPGWIRRMCDFTGGTRNADEFDATVHLITRAILLSVRTGKLPSPGLVHAVPDSPFMPGSISMDPHADARATLAAISQLGDTANRDRIASSALNPFHGFCGGGCGSFRVIDNRQFCIRHNKPMTAFDGCGDFSPDPPPEQDAEPTPWGISAILPSTT